MLLKDLLQHKIIFQWLPEHEATFVQARKTLSADASLAYYDARKETQLFTDASRLKGLRFFLKQKQEDGIWRTVQAGSRYLSPAESRYAMIELEMLGIA
jgi:RNase H-like domain found in reverse transcriptase